MRYSTWCASLLGGALLLITAMAPAHAQATRTWVSGVGDDANPCSRTAPCKTFAGAISKTAAKGEINVIDPGGFGAVTITKSISIISVPEAGVLVSGTNGIIVNVAAATDRVVLEGLDFEGLGTGLNGVTIIGKGTTVVRKCTIRNFTGFAVNVAGTSGARAVVEDSFIFNNGSGANGGGISVVGASNAANSGVLQNTVLEGNVTAVKVGATSSILLMGSTLLNSTTAISTAAGGQTISYGNNVIRGTGLPTSTTPLQ